MAQPFDADCGSRRTAIPLARAHALQASTHSARAGHALRQMAPRARPRARLALPASSALLQ
ncbi:UNVERIFIED_CONTAM: hypothetical protein Slati_3461300 [Sesamum latifolium]|uniref:Uncharacterized protein n=1 Tax=Sesamum latifolium TaxID=2727402 RepID=A0AAW2UH78_9LAMI